LKILFVVPKILMELLLQQQN